MVTHIIIYNVLLSIILYASLAINPRMWIHRMPPEVRAKIEDKTKQEKKLFAFIAIPLLLIMFFYPVFVVYFNYSKLTDCMLYLTLFYVSFNLVDTLILDILIFARITPSFVMIRGTNRNDYKNINYHIKAGIKGMFISVISGSLIGLILFFVKGI